MIQAQVMVQLTATPTSASPNTPITFTVNIVPVNGGTTAPTGTITLFDGNKQIGTMTLSNGTATLAISNLNKGAHSISL